MEEEITETCEEESIELTLSEEFIGEEEHSLESKDITTAPDTLSRELSDLESASEDSEAEIEFDVDRKEQINRILRIIEDCKIKLKISLVMPRIFDNPVLLRQYLLNTKYEECLLMLEDFLRLQRQNPPQMETFELEENPALIRVIDAFQHNYPMLDILPDWMTELSEDEKELLETFTLLKELTIKRLQKSAARELEREKAMHNLSESNERMKAEILELREKVRKERSKLRWKVGAKDAIKEALEQELHYKKIDSELTVKKAIVQSSLEIKALAAESGNRKRELEEELERTKALYEKTVKTNMLQEKDARAEKNKVLLQLQGLLKKYDQTITDRVRENMTLQEEYEEHKRDFEDYMKDFRKEEAVYDSIVTAKKQEDKRRHEERLWIFMMNRSARVVQRAYKAYRKEVKKIEREKEKQKKAKGKGKDKGGKKK